jgi:hypothetical protein
MRGNYFISDFYCTECGNRGIPLSRTKFGKRESGHLKILYCIHCRRETNFAEVRPNSPYTKEDFMIEFKEGNFEGGLRKKTYKECLSDYYKKGCACV